MFRAAAALTIVLCLAPQARAQSVASLFTKLPADFGHLFEPTTGLILGASGAAAAAVHPQDAAIATRLHATGDGWEETFDGGGLLGDGATQGAAALGVYVIGRAAHAPRMASFGADLVRGQIVGGVLADGVKVVANRTRPDGGKYSFPSGHAEAAFVTATVIERHFGWKAAAPAYALAAYIGASRLAEYRHFTSDVLFGAGIGMAAGRATTFERAHSTISIAPQVTHTSAAAVVTIDRKE
jgi:membrane-associated phospholipid phosphatase